MRSVFILSIFSLLFACGDDLRNDNNLEKASTTTIQLPDVSGRWKWISTTGSGIAGPYSYTLESHGQLEYLTFENTESLKIQHHIHGEIFTEYYHYSIKKENDRFVLILTDDQDGLRNEILEVKDNTLHLYNYEPCCDNEYHAVYIQD